MGLRERIFRLIDEDNKEDLKANTYISSFIMFLIVLSILAVIIQSEKSINDKYEALFYWFEAVAVIVFSLEYLARLYTARLAYPELSPFRAMVKYVLSPMAIVDLLAILPFYIELFAGMFGVGQHIDLRFIRVLRLMRLLRIFKLNRYNSGMKMIGDVLKEEKEKLYITLFITSILLVLSSALVFTVEHDAQPEAFPNIYSSMWWAIATLTTVGYGDVYPITTMGKILAGMIALLGIGLVALPTGILSGSFVQAINDQKEEMKKLNLEAMIEEKTEDLEDKMDENTEELSQLIHNIIEEHGHTYGNCCPHCGENIDGIVIPK